MGLCPLLFWIPSAHRTLCRFINYLKGDITHTIVSVQRSEDDSRESPVDSGDRTHAVRLAGCVFTSEISTCLEVSLAIRQGEGLNEHVPLVSL